ncbi:MAG: Mur ligase family protein [Candidatus Sulfobium sp.]|jgi:UDP-N-acetylmuramate--alanine ligase
MKLFFSGIGGSGVSALAGFLAERGHTVSGSDRLFDLNPRHRMCARLKAAGIRIAPQDGSGIDESFDLAVFSTAVESNNPDRARAEELGLPVKTRPEYLAETVSSFRTVAVAGTSGKSTTSGMLAFLMERLGMEPGFIGGGRVKDFVTERCGGNYLAGRSGLLVIEACESDGSIVDYRPAHSIILNLSLDHHEISDTAVMFKKLCENTSGLVITGGDDENMSRWGLNGQVSFSIDRESDYRAENIEYRLMSTVFTVRGRKFTVPLPGKHNVYNAVACIAFLSESGAPLEDISDVIPEFSGIERRFDIHLRNENFLVVDDYAHNPHKIFNLMRTMKGISGSVCYIFQPHGYGPTRLLKEGYIKTFAGNLREPDHLFLLPIYYAGGTAARDISSEDIIEAIAASGKPASAIRKRGHILGLLGKWKSYVIFGARDDSLSDYAGKIASVLRGKGAPGMRPGI